MQNHFGLLDTNMMPIFMIIALDIVIIMRSSINCLAVICSPIIIISILREASSETYGPRVYFPSYKFQFYYFAICHFSIYKPKIPKIFTLPFIYLYQISPLQITMKGLTTPYRVGCKLVLVCVGIQWLVRCLLLDWYLGSQTEGNTYSTLLHHPSLFKGKKQRKVKR